MLGKSATSVTQRAPFIAAPSTTLALLMFGGAFGFIMAVIKGQDAGLRYEIGNVGSLWLLIPAWIGLANHIPLRAAARTLVVTWAGLLAFYFTADHHTLSAWSHVSHNRTFFLIVGGLGAALFSAITSIVATSRRWLGLLPLGLTFLAEPLIIHVLSPQGSVGGKSAHEVYIA